MNGGTTRIISHRRRAESMQGNRDVLHHCFRGRNRNSAVIDSSPIEISQNIEAQPGTNLTLNLRPGLSSFPCLSNFSQPKTKLRIPPLRVAYLEISLCDVALEYRCLTASPSRSRSVRYIVWITKKISTDFDFLVGERIPGA